MLMRKRIPLLLLTLLLATLPVAAQATQTEDCPHNYETRTVDPTCTQDGYTLHTCTLCQDSYESDPVAMLGHDLKKQEEIPATCTQKGQAEHYLCDRCQAAFWDDQAAEPVEDEKQLETPKIDHDYTFHQEVIPPTCKDGGYTRHDCQCGAFMTDTETEKVACAELTYHEEQAATCTATGTKAHYQCPVCEKIYWDAEGTQQATAEELVLAKADHICGEWETTVPPTAESGGQQVRKCQNCDYTETKTLDPLTETLKKPTLSVTVDGTTGKPVLSWDKISGAKAYRVYRKDLETWVLLDTVTGQKMTDTTAVGGESYTYRVVAVNDTACSPASAEKSVLCKCATPVITVGRDTKTGKPVISWETVEGAVKYRVSWSTKSSTGFKTLTDTTQTSAIHTGATVGTKYYYKVQALGPVSDANSGVSAEKSYVCDCAQPVVSAKPGSSKGIRLSWKKVSGAKRYQVYRSDKPDGTYTKLTSTTSTSYTDTSAPKNKVSYYKVRAYGSSTTSMSAYSEILSYANHTFGSWTTVVPNTWKQTGRQERVCSACGETEGRSTKQLKKSLSKPKISLSNHKTSGKPVIKWDKVSGATKYQVYVYDDATGKKIFLAETDSRSYTYKAAVPGKRYSFAVLALNSSKCSTYASDKRILCKTATPELSFTRDDVSGKTVIRWKAVEGATKYKVYWSSSKSGSFKELKETTDLSVTVTSAYPGKTYYYKIKAIHSNASANSATGAVVSSVCDCPQVKAIAVQSAESKGLQISWSGVTGGKNYEVYRATAENGTYIKVATVSGTSYTDTAAPANQTVYYKVRAYGASTSSRGAYSPVNSAMNHTYSEWDYQIPNTSEQAGYRERTCSHCGDVEGQELPRLKKELSTPKVTVTAHATSGKPVISWTGVSKAKEYRIYIYDATNACYTLLTDTTKKSYTYNKAVPGESYAFAVEAINDTQCSPYSAKKSVMCRCATPALSVSADADSGKPKLQWNAVEGAAKYEIYRYSSSKGYELYKTVEGTSLQVTSAAVGKSYSYKIKAIHASNKSANSARSDAKKTTCKLARPVVTGGYVGTKTNLLEWNKVTGAKKYYVYRATSENGSYSRIETTTKTRFIDYVSKGKTYYYKVVAVGESSSINSARSQAVSSLNPSPAKLKIYISPSSQKDNIYYKCGGTSEATQCRAISQYLEAALDRCGFDAKTDVKTDSMFKRVKDSNKWGADLHIPLHTNAHNRKTTGTRIFYDYYKKEKSLGYKIGKDVMKTLGALTPGGPDMMQSNQLYEIGAIDAPSVYIEVEFHDNAKMAKWIVENKQAIAESICEGLCKFYGVTYIPAEAES